MYGLPATLTVVSLLYDDQHRPVEDLTARARIRDVAVAQFARHGFAGTTMRAVAEAAGVSVGLVQHHFGSKDGLRHACDEAVLELVQRKIDVSRNGELGRPSVVASLYEQGAPLLRYVARAAVDGSSGAGGLLAAIARATEGFLSDTWPERFPPGGARARDAAAVMVAMNLGPVLLHDQLAALVDFDPEAGLPPRLGAAMVDVLAALGDYVTRGPGAAVRDALDEVAP